MELLEELQVVLEHQADVVDAILQHGDTLDADAEGEAGILVRVDIAVLQHLAVDDTAAQHLDPAGVLAQRASRFVEALQKQDQVEYLLDVLLFGETEEKAALITDYGKDVIQLEQRMAELAAADAARTKKHHERHAAAPEH